jgi:hypothetical protein
MNEKQADAMLKSLKRIESFLEAIDWKLWNFHQKVIGTGTTETDDLTSEDEETEQLAAVIESPKKAPAAEPKKSAAVVPGYPTIEKWN